MVTMGGPDQRAGHVNGLIVLFAISAIVNSAFHPVG